MVKAVDRKTWITTGKIAVPLEACAVMATQIQGVNVLIDVLDLLFREDVQLGKRHTFLFTSLVEPQGETRYSPYPY